MLVVFLLFVSCTIKISAETTNITWTDELYNFTKTELNDASSIWHDFQTFALRHSSLPNEEAVRLCNRFQDKDMRNFSRIGMDPKGPLANRPTRILFLTTKRSLLLLNDRWYFELYVAMANQPNVEVTMWGTGCPGYRDEESTKQNLLRWFGETTFDIIHSTWTYQRTIRYEEDIGSSLGVGHPQSRSREFIDLPGDPLITGSINLVIAVCQCIVLHCILSSSYPQDIPYLSIHNTLLTPSPSSSHRSQSWCMKCH